MKQILLLFIASFIYIGLTAQTVQKNGPYQSTLKSRHSIQLPNVDVEPLLKEDAENERLKIGPWRFGYNFNVNYNLNNSGNWSVLQNGDKLWEIEITAKEALSLNFIFNDFYLPNGTELYIFSQDRKDIIGAYTSINNNKANTLGTDLLQSNNAVIQLYVPSWVTENPRLKIGTITHGYKSLKGYAHKLAKDLNDSQDCNIDVNCPLGDGWENQIRAVAMIVVNGSGACTGTLINNTKQDGTPYFLTANHCGTNVTNWAFRFNWESPTPSCATTTGSAPDNDYDTMNGAELIANNSGSDFSLVKLVNEIPLEYNVYFAGWDKSDVMNGAATGIHHPSGDIKKICQENETVYHNVIDFNGNSSTQIWHIDDWDQGVTEPGSSGSALFDSKGRIIGQLAGGYAACQGTNDNNEEDWYGRFATSWDAGSTPNTRLKEWLDPLNIGLDTLDGFDPNSAAYNKDIRVASIEGVKENMCESNLNENIKPFVKAYNQGSDTIQTFTLYIKYDQNQWDSLTYANENWLPLTPKTLILPEISKTIGDHTIEVYLSNPNGMEDENHLNDSAKVNYTVKVGNLLDFDLTLDYYPEETSWNIMNDENIIIDSGDNYSEIITISNDYCLVDDCYSFNIYDSGENGLEGFFSFWNTGSYSGINVKGETLFELHQDSLNFGAEKSHYFCFPDNNSIRETYNALNIDIYPNPTSNILFVKSNNNETKQISLTNIFGQEVFNTITSESLSKIDLSGYSSGNYVLKIKLNNEVSTHKVQLIEY